jgi:hypothetical protein
MDTVRAARCSMRRLSRSPLYSLQSRTFITQRPLCNEHQPKSDSPLSSFKPEHLLTKEQLASIAHSNLTKHPQAPAPTKGIGPFTTNVETGKRLTFREREEEKAKEYLYEKPDLNQPLPPLLLRPPGLSEPPRQGQGHGKETRSWWQREFEIWFGRYQKPFDVQAQVQRHKTMYSPLTNSIDLLGILITLNGVQRRIGGV